MKVIKLLAICKIILSILIILVKAEHHLNIINRESYLLYQYGNELVYVFQLDHNIDTINLEKNGIEDIAARSFENTNFTEINLQRNKLKIIRNKTFYNTNVKIINLQRNGIEQIDQGAFCGLALKKLDLSNNNLSYIDNYMFDRLTIYGVLNLSFNKITTISHLNVFNKNISCLFLQNNQIKSIEKGSFYGMKVQRLDLSFNLLTKIESGTFEGLTTVDLDRGFWSGDMEEGLTLSNNNLTKIYDNAFERSMISTINLYGVSKYVLINKDFWGISISTEIYPH